MSETINPTVLQMLERNIGKKILVVLDRNYGFEGVIATVSQDPPGLWMSNANSVVLRGTLANPTPQIVSREDRSELFITLSSVQRIEVLH